MQLTKTQIIIGIGILVVIIWIIWKWNQNKNDNNINSQNQRINPAKQNARMKGVCWCSEPGNMIEPHWLFGCKFRCDSN